MKIGEKIKKLRIERQMTQTEICGDYITRNMLSKIENGSATPSVQTMEHIAKQLGVGVSELFEDEPPKANREIMWQESLDHIVASSDAEALSSSFETYLNECNDKAGLEGVLCAYCVSVYADVHVAEALCRSGLIRKPDLLLQTEAAIAIKHSRFEEAVEKLSQIDLPAEPQTMARVYAELERCYIALGDYKMAYQAVKQREAAQTNIAQSNS